MAPARFRGVLFSLSETRFAPLLAISSALVISEFESEHIRKSDTQISISSVDTGRCHAFINIRHICNKRAPFFTPFPWSWVGKILRYLWVFSNKCNSPDLTVTSVGTLCLNCALGPICPRYQTLYPTVSECSIS